MSFSVNTNAGAFYALQNLNATGDILDRTQTRINTGYKVSSARDNAAVFSIAQNLRADVAGYNAVKSSLDRAISEVDIALAGAEAISDILIELKEKAVAAKDDGLDATSRSALNDDFQELLEQVTSIAENASFNGRNLLTGDTVTAITDANGTGSGTISTSVTQLTLSSLSLDDADISSNGGGSYTSTADFQPSSTAFTFDQFLTGNTGAEAAYTQAFQREGWISGSQTALGLVDGSTKPSDVSSDLLAYFVDDATWTPTGTPFLNVDTVNEVGGYAVRGGTFITNGSGAGASAAVDTIETAIDTVSTVLSSLGSTANRLALQNTFTGKLSDSINVGIGNLVDADLAKESALLQATQTKQQLGLQALSIANQGPQTVLSLFR